MAVMEHQNQQGWGVLPEPHLHGTVRAFNSLRTWSQEQECYQSRGPGSLALGTSLSPAFSSKYNTGGTISFSFQEAVCDSAPRCMDNITDLLESLLCWWREAGLVSVTSGPAADCAPLTAQTSRLTSRQAWAPLWFTEFIRNGAQWWYYNWMACLGLYLEE